MALRIHPPPLPKPTSPLTSPLTCRHIPTSPQSYLDSHTIPPPSAITDLVALLEQHIVLWRELSKEQQLKQESEEEEGEGEGDKKRHTFLRWHVELLSY
ncbi:hypothetical protein PM082_023634 [Marasmius tenuissimus]|nr:hypothetical protein PM082_023634 [Marasmius tenuissimus]